MHNSNRVIRRDERYDNKILRLNETLFSNANGYIGVRGTLEEGVPADFSTMRGMYLAGVYEIIPMKQAESLCNLIEKKQPLEACHIAPSLLVSALCQKGKGFTYISLDADTS